MRGVIVKNDISIQNLLDIYEKEISKNVKNKRKVRSFENNKMQNIIDILTMLRSGNVGHKKYNIFLIREPKVRLVMSLNINDKIINHFMTRYVLEKKLDKYLDIRNCATRKDMGTDYALRLLFKYLNQNKKYEKLYVLKVDISKYFYTIDHEILKGQLVNRLDSDEYKMICAIIDSTNADYINEVIKKIMEKKDVDVPLYEKGRGLPIGNVTSQFLSIYYLSALDHYIIHNLGFKHYVRYMDDFVLISPDKEKLIKAKEVIVAKLRNEYKLKAHEKKTQIYDLKHGFSFLGYVVRFNENKKSIVKLKNSNYEKIKRRVKEVNYMLEKGLINHRKAFCSMMTYSNCYGFCSGKKVKEMIDRYFYEQK